MSTNTDPKRELRVRLDELEALIEDEDDPEARAVYRRIYQSLSAEGEEVVS